MKSLDFHNKKMRKKIYLRRIKKGSCEIFQEKDVIKTNLLPKVWDFAKILPILYYFLKNKGVFCKSIF